MKLLFFLTRFPDSHQWDYFIIREWDRGLTRFTETVNNKRLETVDGGVFTVHNVYFSSWCHRLNLRYVPGLLHLSVNGSC